MGQHRFLAKSINLLLAVVLVTAGLLPAAPAFAQSLSPALTGVTPGQAANDVDTPISITGSGFSNTDGVPLVFLGEHPLTQVEWIDETSLTAVVPWGLEPGIYDLRVVNPDLTEASLASAFEVTQGIGRWNANAMDGGPVQVVVPVAATEGLIYAYSVFTSAVYRSTDYGENWVTVGHTAGQHLTIDPLNPAYMYIDLKQSADSGATWTSLLVDDLWPGTENYPASISQVFPDPAHSGTIFLASANIPTAPTGESGLLRSTDYGQTWEFAETGLLPGDNNVTVVEFYGNDLYLGTNTGNLYKSTDGGDNWNRIGDTNVLPTIGVLKVNPYEPSELWITTHKDMTAAAQIIKMDLSDPAYTTSPVLSWSADRYPVTLGFLDAESVYIGTNWDDGWITTDDGENWSLFRPSTGKPGYCLAIDPWDDTQNTFYIADEQYGVQKTIDRGLNWTPVNNGLHAMSPDYLAVDPANPSRVYAKIAANGWPGIFVSNDGGQNWNFSSLVDANEGERPITSMVATSGSRVFAGAHGYGVDGEGPQLFISDNQGEDWRRVNIDVDETPAYPDSFYMPWLLTPDPTQPETLLLGVVIGSREQTSDQYTSEIYRSTDNGETWQSVNLATQLGYEVTNIKDIAFDPNNPQTVYASADHAFLKSTDNGVTWTTLVHVDIYWLGGPIAVEPVAPYRVYIGKLVSLDGGENWDFNNIPINTVEITFVPGSDTLYAAGDGLMYSYDGGSNWQSPQGLLATTQITGLSVSRAGNRTVVYVGTPGGGASEPSFSPFSASSQLSYGSNTPIEAGIYRMTEVRTSIFIPIISRP